jgi:anti-sigma factor RsiW
MKDSEFIQLLNLYLDHEISAADAVRLEAEVQSNPARRRIYQDYCRMQKACKVLAADFKTEPEIATEKKVVAFNPAAARASRSASLYTLGGFAAAAACVAIIFVGRGRQETTPSMADQGAAVAAVQASPREIDVKSTLVAADASGARAINAVVTTPARGERPQAGLVAERLLLTGSTQTEATLATAAQQSNDQFAWIHTVQLTPLQTRVPAEDLRFDVRPATLRPDRALGNRPQNTQEATVEMTAFRFVK